MHIAIIGFGRWGGILFQNICLRSNHIKMISIISSNKIKYDERTSESPIKTGFFSSVEEFIEQLNGKKCDAIIIATPPFNRISIIQKIIGYCGAIFCEKPVSLLPEETKKIIQLVKKHSVPFIVDYVHLFSEGFRYIHAHCNLGHDFEIYCQSGGNGPLRDYNALWDYGPHDISMILTLTKEHPTKITARNTTHDILPGLSCLIELEFTHGKAIIDLSNQRQSKKRIFQIKNDELWTLDDTKTQDKLIRSGVAIPLKQSPSLLNAVDAFIVPSSNTYHPDHFTLMEIKISSILELCNKQLQQQVSATKQHHD